MPERKPISTERPPGAEIDLLLVLPGGALWAIEIKHSLSPKLERGFHHACADLNPQLRIVVYPGDETYPLSPGIEAMSLKSAGMALQET